MTERLVIIGNGMAPGRMLEHLLEAAPERYRITIFNALPIESLDRLALKRRMDEIGATSDTPARA